MQIILSTNPIKPWGGGGDTLTFNIHKAFNTKANVTKHMTFLATIWYDISLSSLTAVFFKTLI